MQYSMMVRAMGVVLAGCDKTPEAASDAPPPAGNDSARTVQKEAREALATARERVGESKEQFVAVTEAKLKELDVKIAELGVKMQTLQADAQTEGSKALQSLQEQRAKLAPKFEEVKQASQATWEQTKAGFEAALSEVQKACSDLKSKLGA
jgi:TolA-binding protein